MKTEKIGFYVFERAGRERAMGPQVFDSYEDAMAVKLPPGKLYWVHAPFFDECDEVDEIVAEGKRSF